MANNSTIKKGMILSYKLGQDEIGSKMVLGKVADGIFVLSITDEYDKADAIYTETEIEVMFDIPEQQWEPVVNKPYYTVLMRNAKPVKIIWYDDVEDKARLKLGLVWESRERANKVLQGMKTAIENIK